MNGSAHPGIARPPTFADTPSATKLNAATATNPFRKSKPLTQLSVPCPFCEKVQNEPVAAVSTFCRSCGEHFEIAGGEVVSPDAASITGIATVIEPTEGGELVRVPGTRKPVSIKPPPGSRKSPLPGLLGRIKATLSGHSFTDGDSPSTPQGSSHASPVPVKGQRSVRCFECGQIQLVTAAARSTQCGRCTRYISLEDYEITDAWSHIIQTRGDITIAKHGKLIGTEVACHDLTVNGELSASVDCSGDAVFRGPGRILGTMHCRHLRVERKAKLTFPHGIVAESADLYGQLDGNLLCSGTVHVYKSARILGDITASKIEIADGGLLSGKGNIEENIELPPYPKKTHRFDR